jgi:molybdopterin/thiamine biosynthesis adenylyltransferase
MSKQSRLQTKQEKLEGSEPSRASNSSALILRCQRLQNNDESVGDRQEGVPGFSQAALSELTVLLVGAGALGGEIAECLVRKGVGTLKILDFDTVELTNLNRQFFFANDIGTPKAWALARNISPHGLMGTRIIAHNLSFAVALEKGVDLSCDVIVSAVDDGQARGEIASFGLEHKIPVIFGGASQEANFAKLFVQEPGQACFACACPEEAGGQRTPCPGSPAIKDLFMLLGSYMVYAIDSLFMDRPREWNLHTFCPRDAAFTESSRVVRRPDCPICGDAS